MSLDHLIAKGEGADLDHGEKRGDRAQGEGCWRGTRGALGEVKGIDSCTQIGDNLAAAFPSFGDVRHDRDTKKVARREGCGEEPEPRQIWALRASSVRPVRQRERLQYKFATGAIEGGRSTTRSFAVVRGSLIIGSSTPAIPPCFRFSLAVVRSREHTGPIPQRAYGKSLGGGLYVS